MKIVHINNSDNSGGAAIAAHRLHEAMLQNGIESKMLVLNNSLKEPNTIQAVSTIKYNLLRRVLNRLVIKRLKPHGAWSWNHYGFDLSKNKDVLDADIIYLHWINNYTISIASLEKILKLGKPVYWFMHDMWPITGGCHYSLDCEKYSSQCFKCPMYFNKKGSKISKDLSYYQFKEKFYKLSKYTNLHFITPSTWLANCVRKSALFNNHKVKVCRNLLDVNKFQIKDKSESRKRLGLPENKFLVLFGADTLTSPYKGWDILKYAFKNQIENLDCVVYGGGTEEIIKKELAQPLHFMGKITDTEKLIDLYNACDIFITPSFADNYPNVILEANACGLPVIGSNRGGIPEMIETGKNGIIVKNLNGNSFLEAILEIKENKYHFERNRVREIVELNNSYDKLFNYHTHLK